MTIKYAILGLLSWKPFTGYDLKKVFANSTALYWSGNNNQIYKALLQLRSEGLVSDEVQHQDHSPTKKLYTVTEKGLAELKAWVISVPEPLEHRNTFLIQLAWADQLNGSELNTLLDKYEEEIKMQVLMQQEKERRGTISPQRTEREVYLWSKISGNLANHYQIELYWIRKLRMELNEKWNA